MCKMVSSREEFFIFLFTSNYAKYLLMLVCNWKRWKMVWRNPKKKKVIHNAIIPRKFTQIKCTVFFFFTCYCSYIWLFEFFLNFSSIDIFFFRFDLTWITLYTFRSCTAHAHTNENDALQRTNSVRRKRRKKFSAKEFPFLLQLFSPVCQFDCSRFRFRAIFPRWELSTD